MKRLFLALLLLYTPAWAVEFPQPVGLVNDFADVIDEADERALYSKLEAIKESGKSEVAIVTIRSLEGLSSAEYATQLGKEWGVGARDTNNGIVLLWVPSDRKVFIATGFGTEAVLPDIAAGAIVHEIIVPLFKQDKYAEGLNAAVDEISRTIAETQVTATPQEDWTAYDTPGVRMIIGGVLFVGVLALIVILIDAFGGSQGGYIRYTPAPPKRSGVPKKGGSKKIARKVVYEDDTTRTASSRTTSFTDFGGSSGGGFDSGGSFGGGSFGGGGAGGDY